MSQLIAEREQFHRSCMAEQGFSYVPQLPVRDTPVSDGLDLYLESGFDLESNMEFSAQFGFDLFSDLSDSDLLERELSWRDDGEEVDPNVAIRDSLGEAEKQAYALAQDDCITEAETRFPPPQLDGDVGQLLGQLHDEFDARFDSDSRILSATAVYAKCVTDAGFDVVDGQSLVEHMKGRFWEMTNLVYDDLGREDLSRVDEQTLRELQAEERAAAQVDAECNAELYSIRDQVGIEIEQEIIEAHPEVLMLLESEQ